MKKIRLTRVEVVEYEPNPEYYPEGSTIEQMAQMDSAETNDVRDEIFMSDLKSEKITYEIIGD